MGYPTRDEKERTEVEWVMGLTGGELEDKPLRFLEVRKVLPWQPGEFKDWKPQIEFHRWWRPYWYTGSPDYAREIDRRWRGEVMTIVSDETFGMLPRKIIARGKVWRKVARFASSGECECPNGQGEAIGAEGCTFCEEKITHGYLYLGDGWGESVYVAR